MFFVTVGTAPQPFHRLIAALTKLSAEVQQETVFQGTTEAGVVLAFRHKPFMTPDEHKQMMNDADVVVCHAGIGTVRECYDMGKKTIVLPRLARYGEHFNNHQLELVKYLFENPLPNIYPLLDPSHLAEKLREVFDLSEKARLPGEFGQELKDAIAADVKSMLE